MAGNIVPRSDGGSDVGTADKEWRRLYAKDLGGTVAGLYAKKNSPAFTGTPTAPTAAAGTNTAQIATTAFVAGEASEHNDDINAHGKIKIIGDIYKTVGASHNAIFRGKNLTTYFESGNMSTAIAAGNFDDIFIGDYINKAITVGGITYQAKWEVADIDYFLHSGNDDVTTHHVVLFPSDVIKVYTPMNDSNTTAGGYVGSKMFTEIIPAFDTAIEAAFGAGHVLAHKELLSTSVDTNAASAAGAGYTGSANNWEWKICKSNIPSEPMIYGGSVWGSSAFDVGNKTKQLALFRFKNFSESRKWFWLQAVVSSSSFVAADSDGAAYSAGASASHSSGGVRPYFLLH